MIDPEVFGAELGKVVKEIIAPLKEQISDLQRRVAELEELTEGLK